MIGFGLRSSISIELFECRGFTCGAGQSQPCIARLDLFRSQRGKTFFDGIKDRTSYNFDINRAGSAVDRSVKCVTPPALSRHMLT